MHYLIEEKQLNKSECRHAGVKARFDVSNILKDNGYTNIEIAFDESGYGRRKLKKYYDTYRVWKESCEILKKDDLLLIQYPVINHSFLLGILEKRLWDKGVKVVILVHDIRSLRMIGPSNYKSLKKSLNKKRQLFEEKMMLKYASHIIVHNNRMKEYLEGIGIRKNVKIELQIFDYYDMDWDSARSEERNINKDGPVIIAGNLKKDKSGFVYNLPDNQLFSLYGINYKGESMGNVIYNGAYDSDELPYKLEGSFGLVWDGPSSDECLGVYGYYLKYNSPHKTSLYLASEIPVIIWDKSALADYILDNNLGFTISSLDEIHDKITKLSEKEYESMRSSVKKMASKLRQGYHTLKAISI